MNRKYNIKVVGSADNISDEDRDIDLRARSAVEAAVAKAKICRKPIAKYDRKTGKAYLEYPDGRKQYV